MALVRKFWTPEEDAVLHQYYPDNGAAFCVARLVDRNMSAVYERARFLGIKVTKERVRQTGLMGAFHPKCQEHWFKKGQPAHNKGVPMSAEAREKCKGTFFKKGRIPANKMKVGDISYKKNDGYLWIKVAEPDVWKQWHRKMWEDAYGEIPAGYNIQFKNGNARDVRLDNLYMISKVDQITKENSMYAKYPKELCEVMRMRGTLTRLTKKRNNGK